MCSWKSVIQINSTADYFILRRETARCLFSLRVLRSAHPHFLTAPCVWIPLGTFSNKLGKMLTWSYRLQNSCHTKAGAFSFLLSTEIWVNLRICISAFPVQCGDQEAKLMGWLLNDCRKSEYVAQTSRTVVKKKWRITALATNTWLLSGGRQELLL